MYEALDSSFVEGTTANHSFVVNNQETTANDSFVLQNEQIDTDSDNYITEEEEASDEDSNIDAPPFSPISSASNDEPVEEQRQKAISEKHDENSNTLNEDNNDQSEWSGFTMEVDNLDKNTRRSFQRIDYQTLSLHICNVYVYAI